MTRSGTLKPPRAREISRRAPDLAPRTRDGATTPGPVPPARRRARLRGRRALHVGLALGAVYVIWGSTYLAIEVAIGSMPPLLMLSARFAIAGSLLLVIAGRRGDHRGDPLTFRQVRHSAVTGATLLVGGTGVLVLAQGTLSSGLTALLAATVPLFLALFARGFFGERLSMRAWAGLLVGIGGIVLLVDPSGGQLGAILLALTASAAWAAGSLRSRIDDAPRRPLVAASLEMLAASVLFLLIGLLRGEHVLLDLAAIRPAAWGSFAYLVVAGSLVGYTAYSWLTRHASTSLVGTFAYVNPVVAVTLGWAVLGETVAARTIVAGAVVLLSVVLLVTGRPGEPVPAQVTSGGDVFAGSVRWHRVQRRVGGLPRAARLFRDPGVRQYRSVGNEPPLEGHVAS